MKAKIVLVFIRESRQLTTVLVLQMKNTLQTVSEGSARITHANTPCRVPDCGIKVKYSIFYKATATETNSYPA